MNVLLALFWLFSADYALASGCMTQIKYPKEETVTLNGRQFLAVVPENYDNLVPGRLIIAFHGYGMNSGWMHSLVGGLEGKADNHAVFFYPQSSGPSWQQWSGSQDVQFFDWMVEHAKSRYCIGKIYAEGFSNGAFFVNWLTTQKRSSLSAVAVAGGGGGGADIPAIVIHGYQDQFVSFGSGDSTRWSYYNANQCQGSFTWIGPDNCQRAVKCAKNDIVWCPWNGPHHWPDFAHQAVWDLFKRY
jgi:polyhydroxybutyrate depolymerase